MLCRLRLQKLRFFVLLEFSRSFHFHVQPIGAHIKTVGPGRCAKVEKDTREIGRVFQWHDHGTSLLDKRRAVVNAVRAVAEANRNAIGRNGFDLIDPQPTLRATLYFEVIALRYWS